MRCLEFPATQKGSWNGTGSRIPLGEAAVHTPEPAPKVGGPAEWPASLPWRGKGWSSPRRAEPNRRVADPGPSKTSAGCVLSIMAFFTVIQLAKRLAREVT